MKAAEFEAVKETLSEFLDTTADDTLWLNLSPEEVSELQAAVWQVLTAHDDLERRRLLAVAALTAVGKEG